MKKKIISLALCAAMLLTMLTVPVFGAAGAFTKTSDIRATIVSAANAQIGKKYADFKDDGMPSKNWGTYFIAWLARKSGAAEEGILPNKYGAYSNIYQPITYTANSGTGYTYCYDSASEKLLSGSAGQYYGDYSRSDYTPVPGDLVMIKNSGTSYSDWDQIGLITKVADGKITYVVGCTYKEDDKFGPEGDYSSWYVVENTLELTAKKIRAVTHISYNGVNPSCESSGRFTQDYTRLELSGYDGAAGISSVTTVASSKLSGINITLADGALVLYDRSRLTIELEKDSAAIICDNTGKVTALKAYGEEADISVPKEGFVIAGDESVLNETSGGGYLFTKNIKLGDYIKVEYVSDSSKDNKVTAYRGTIEDAVICKTGLYVMANTALGKLPALEISGQKFMGWYTPSAVKATETTKYDGLYKSLKAYFGSAPTKPEPETPSSPTEPEKPADPSTPENPSGGISDTAKVTFNLNGGDGSIDPVIAINGNAYSSILPKTEPTRTGYVFNGWYTKAEEGEKIDPEAIMAMPADTTLYAQWTKKGYLTVKFNAMGGTVDPEFITVDAGTKREDFPTPVKAGYKFDGWYDDDGTKTKITYASCSDGQMGKPEKTLYAHWTMATAKFNDVKTTDWFYTPVYWAVDKGITAGTTNTTFSPNTLCSKAHIITFIWNSQGKPEPKAETKNTFSDVKTTDYFYKAVLWAKEKNMISGTKFYPNANCTRAMAVEFLWKGEGCPSVSGTSLPFTDVAANAGYRTAVMWALDKKVTAGISETKFGPEQTTTRAQIVTFLYNYMK